MKQERARELYSDYQEGTLSPAMRLALEQHFQADPAARADYDEFAQVYALFDARPVADVDVPRGFRAKVLELAVAEKAQREAQAGQGLLGWLRGLDPRHAAARIGVSLAAVAAVLVIVLHPIGSGSVKVSTMGPGLGISNTVAPTVIQTVTSGLGADGNTYHYFKVHLPSNVLEAAVTASVITSLDQITDPAARQQGAVTALTNPQVLTNDESLQIPIALGAVPPAGTTLTLLVQWQPTNGGPAGSQVVFTPVSTPDPSALTSPNDGKFYTALQSVASAYGATVIADTTSPQTQTVTMPPASEDALAPLQNIANQVGDSVRPLQDGTYQIYKP